MRVLNYSTIDETVEPEEIDVNSFELHDELNPDIWDNGRLNIKVRRALLNIARDFIAGLPFVIKIEDVIMTGSLANYNWDKKYSDIDLHIVTDFSNMPANPEIVKSLFNSMKTLWNNKHDGITIKGYPVELYIQDINEKHTATGIYSLLNDDWIVEPSYNKINNDNLDMDIVQKKSAEYCNKIEDLENSFIHEYNKEGLQKIYDDAKLLFDDIKKQRSNAMDKKKAELSTGNLIFKSLRRNGYIERLLDLFNNCYDRLRSL